MRAPRHAPHASTRRAWAGTLVALCLGLTGLAGAAPQVQAADTGDDLGCGDQLVTQQLANGASWRLCVRVQPYQGLVLENVEFHPATGDREYAGYKRILDSLALAQLNVAYDNGGSTYDDVTDYGFGGDHLLTQTPETCTGQTREVTNVSTASGSPTERTIPGICLTTVSTGLAYESQEWSVDGGPRYAAQGTGLEISTLSKVGWYEYQQQITLDDEGGINIGLGATGDVAPGDAPGVFFSTDPTKGWPIGPAPASAGQTYYATSHWHNAIYRVDFGIDSGQKQQVQQWDYTSGATSSGGSTTLDGNPTIQDKAFLAHPTGAHADIAWWRVLNPDSLNPDGHPRSYQIINDNPLDVDNPLTSSPVSFTNAKPCEQYASYNLDPGCPNEDVLDYVADDQAPLTDPVAWVNVDFHHVDRDEDQSPMHTHWQYFQLIPRDFFAQGPVTPDARSCIDGPGYVDSYALPCIATDKTPPSITASTSPVAPGTTLRATAGTWNTSRTTWDYAYLWFRDGVPITGTDAAGNPTAATDPTYVLTPADVGHSITVKVTASHPGYVSGTASSAAVTVPGVAAGGTPSRPASVAPSARSGGQSPAIRSGDTTATALELAKDRARWHHDRAKLAKDRKKLKKAHGHKRTRLKKKIRKLKKRIHTDKRHIRADRWR